jgi:hypothetical protein
VAITVIDELRRDVPIDREDLDARLRARGESERLPELQTEGLHFMSCAISNPRNDGPVYVILELNVDGAWYTFLDRFVAKQEVLLREMFGLCKHFPRGDVPTDLQARLSDDQMAALIRYIEDQRREHITFHRGTPGRSVAQIDEEARLLDALGESKRRNAASSTSRTELWETIKCQLSDSLRRCIKRTPRRPARVMWNPARPQARKRIGRLSALVVGLTLLIGGLVFVYQGADRPSFWWLVFGIPLLVTFVRMVLDLRESPVRVKWLVKLTTRIRIIGGAIRGGVIVAAACGLIFGAYTHWSALWDPISQGLSILLVIVFLLAGALLGYLSAAEAGAVIGIAAVVGLLTKIDEASLTRNAFLIHMMIAGLVVLALAAMWTVGVMLWLRAREARDKADDKVVPPDHSQKVKKREDRRGFEQNHFASITTIKPRWLRLRILKAVLRVVHLASYFIYNLGYLGNIPAIHFARFVLLPGSRELLFLTNYDGSFGEYLGDFKENYGVTAIWGNTCGFPRPFFLLFQGARDERRFKERARNSQIETLIWYSAYPHLTVKQIDAASDTRRDLTRRLETDRPTIGALLKHRLSESELAVALKRMG